MIKSIVMAVIATVCALNVNAQMDATRNNATAVRSLNFQNAAAEFDPTQLITEIGKQATALLQYQNTPKNYKIVRVSVPVGESNQGTLMQIAKLPITINRAANESIYPPCYDSATDTFTGSPAASGGQTYIIRHRDSSGVVRPYYYNCINDVMVERLMVDPGFASVNVIAGEALNNTKSPANANTVALSSDAETVAWKCGSGNGRVLSVFTYSWSPSVCTDKTLTKYDSANKALLSIPATSNNCQFVTQLHCAPN